MDIYGLLFERNGRIGRLKYLVTSVITNIVCMFLTSIFAHFATLETVRVSFIFMLVIMLTDILVQINLMIKRLHDFNASGWNVLYLYVFMVSTTMIGNGLEYIGQFVALMFYLALLIMPGTLGNNRFDIQQVYD